MLANLNTTMKGTQPSSCFDPTAEKIGKTIAYCLLFIVSLTGNSIIGIIVYKTKTLRKPINFLIANMAMSDLLIPIFLCPLILTKLYVNSWPTSGPLGQALCKLSFFLPNASAGVSVQSMVLIAVDRFGAVLFPLRCPLISSKMCPFFILATWIVAMATISPYLFAYKLVEYPEKLVCTPQWNEVFGESASSQQNYFIALHVIFLYIPLVLKAVLYPIIIAKLKSQKTPGEQSVNSGQQHVKGEQHVLKMVIAIVLAFAVCWLPTGIRSILILVADNLTWSCGFRYFTIVSSFMTHANCAINPYICFIFSGSYRQGFKNIFGCS